VEKNLLDQDHFLLQFISKPNPGPAVVDKNILRETKLMEKNLVIKP
jgi:hypothetical protein